MVYCVVPRELEPELYDRLSAYYADDPEVEVIVDRRVGDRRSRRPRSEVVAQQREVRDRRRRRAVGEVPSLHGEAIRG
jgi:hypothetical protein